MDEKSRFAHDAEVARHWNSNAELWAQEVREGQDHYREVFLEPSFLRFMGDLHGQKLLDAACGEGTSSRFMARNGAQVWGVDISSVMIANAMNAEQQDSLGIRYSEASLCDISQFDEGSFDAAVSWMAMMDVSDYQQAVGEIFRILKPGGSFMFSVKHPCYFTPRMNIFRDPEKIRSVIQVGDYFTEKNWMESWSFSGSNSEQEGVKTFSMLRFPRTLANYLNGLLQCGFMIERVEEPRPDEDMCKILPRLNFWRKHAALYLFVSARKP